MKLRNTTPNSEQIWACCCIDDFVVKASLSWSPFEYQNQKIENKMHELIVRCQ